MNSDRAHGVSRFEAVVPAVILANSVVLGWGWIDHARRRGRADRHVLSDVVPASSFVVRLRRAGWRWLTQPWNLLEDHHHHPGRTATGGWRRDHGSAAGARSEAVAPRPAHESFEGGRVAGASAQQAHRSGEDRGACADMMLAPLLRMDGGAISLARPLARVQRRQRRTRRR